MTYLPSELVDLVIEFACSDRFVLVEDGPLYTWAPEADHYNQPCPEIIDQDHLGWRPEYPLFITPWGEVFRTGGAWLVVPPGGFANREELLLYNDC